MRTELIAAPLVIFAFLILVLAARQASNGRPLVLALAAFLCMLGLENKVHAILPIAALPLMILPFGSAAGTSTPFWQQDPRRWLAAAMVAVAALAFLWISLPLIRTGFDPIAMAATLPAKSLLSGWPGLCQAAVLAWTAIAMVVFSAVWKVSVCREPSGDVRALIGLCAAMLMLDISAHDANVVTVMNPLERMSGFADLSPLSGVGGGSGELFRHARPVGAGRRARAAALHLRLFQFAATSGLPDLAHHSKSRLCLAPWRATGGIAVLMLAVIGIDTIGMRRGLKDEYFIFTDPFIIIAGVVLLDRMNALRFHRLAFPIGFVLIALHVVVGQAEPVKRAFARKGPEGICEWRPQYLPLLQLPWCAKA